MSRFHWITDEQGEVWHEQGGMEGPNRPNRWRWLTLVAILALCALAVWGVWGYLQKRVDTTTQEIEEEIRRSVELLYQSADNGDIELFRTVLSGKDREWTALQLQQVGDGGLLERELFGWELQTALPTVHEIVISPDLRSAVVTLTVPYRYDVGNGVTETVSLFLPTTYRRGESRWLFAPPEETFWGAKSLVMAGGEQVILSGPERDAELIQEVANLTAQLIQPLCQDGHINPLCAEFSLEFSTAPQPFDPWNLAGDEPCPLPTPSLAGVPSDAKSHRLVVQSYARLVLHCVGKNWGVYGAIEWWLAEQGVIAWPLESADYALVARYAPDFFSAEVMESVKTITLLARAEFFATLFPYLPFPAEELYALDTLISEDLQRTWPTHYVERQNYLNNLFNLFLQDRSAGVK